MAAAPQAEALEEERLLGELHAHGGMVRAAQLQHEGDRRRLQAALVQAEDALRRLAADYGAGEARRRAAIDALREEALAGSGDARARLTALEDTALEAARRYDPERRRLQAAKDEALDTLTRSQRDHALEMARLQSVRSQLRARLLEGRFAPAGSRALVAKREALAAGGAWDEAFPKGARCGRRPPASEPCSGSGAGSGRSGSSGWSPAARATAPPCCG